MSSSLHILRGASLGTLVGLTILVAPAVAAPRNGEIEQAVRARISTGGAGPLAVRCSPARPRAGIARWRCISTERPRVTGEPLVCKGRYLVSRRAGRMRVSRRTRRCSLARAIVPPASGPPAPRPPGESPGSRAAARTPRTAIEPKLFGLNDNAVPHLATAEEDAELNSRVGATTHRISVDWRWVERYPGVYSWGRTDEIYRADLARGIRPILLLLFAPTWALEDPAQCNQWLENCAYPPGRQHDDAWRNIAAMLATRYPEAAAIELWNEPNLAGFWSPAPDVGRYTELLKSGYEAIKEVNPAMPVLTGGFAGSPSSVKDGDITVEVSLREFVQGVYEHGGKDFMDGIAFHPYPGGLNDSFFFKSFDDVRFIRDAYGDREKPLWVTEIGLSTSGPPRPQLVTEAEQALGLRHFYRNLAKMPDVRASIFHTLIEPRGGDPEEDREPGFGIMRANREPKPAFCALAQERGTGYQCPPNVALPPRDVERERNWAAQGRVHTALEAARTYHARHGSFRGLNHDALHQIDSSLSATAPREPAVPGTRARPSRIAIYRSPNPQELMLCSASRAAGAYCILAADNGVVAYGMDPAGTWAAAGALASGSSLNW